MKKTKETRENQGITLIALVITIIVLLILAGVSIAMLTGNNGILTQAKLAKENTALAKEDEENKLAKNNEYINEQTGKVVKPGITATKTEKDNYVDSDGNKATIPEGFTVDETEKTISKGLVVHGPDKTNSDNGSEFVWVPVPDINSMSQCSTAGGSCKLQLEDGTLKCTTHNSTDIVGKLYATESGDKFGIENTTYNANSGLREPAYFKDTGVGDASKYNTIGLTPATMQEDYKSMAASVAKYGGFYVGRYETSLSNASSTQANDGDVQSKSGVIPTSAENSATYRWYGLYSKQKEYTGKNSSVESSMIWGSQYDAMLNWAKNGDDKDKITNTSLGNTSSGSVTTAGNSDYSNDSINNIRDLGGNLVEWTQEASGDYFRFHRGGYYSYGMSPSARCNNDMPYRTNIVYGSLFTIYIN